MQNAAPEHLKVVGLEVVTATSTKVQLQQALLASLQAVSLEYSEEDPTTPIVSIDVTKLTPLTNAL